MACAIHTYHFPRPLTTERHHVIPRAWQQTWRPGTAAGTAAVLWSDETILLCPTGHRNVHQHIVEMMRVLELEDSDDPLVAYRALPPRSRTRRVAYRALTGFRGAGGSLLALIDAGQYGRGGTLHE